MTNIIIASNCDAITITSHILKLHNLTELLDINAYIISKYLNNIPLIFLSIKSYGPTVCHLDRGILRYSLMLLHC